MVSPPATSEAGAHAAVDTKSEHFEPARVRKLNEKHFRRPAIIELEQFLRKHHQNQHNCRSLYGLSHGILHVLHTILYENY
jgi:hypothetical protein